MKYLIAIAVTALVIWGVMAFITFLPNPTDWAQITRVTCVFLTLWFSVAICCAMSELGD